MDKKARADICDGDDEESVGLLRKALDAEGAVFVSKDWVAGVDIYTLKIGNEDLAVFIDAWSCDIEGSQEVVDRVKRTYERMKTG